MLRCTGKVLKLLREPTQPIGTASGDDWYANLVWVERRKCLLLTHAGTLFSAFVADVAVADLRPIGPFVASAIRSALRSEGLSVAAFGDLTTEDVRVAKTANRRVLGSMNDLANIATHLIALAGGLASCDVAAVNHDLHRTINSLTGYIPPVELISAGRKA